MSSSSQPDTRVPDAPAQTPPAEVQTFEEPSFSESRGVQIFAYCGLFATALLMLWLLTRRGWQ